MGRPAHDHHDHDGGHIVSIYMGGYMRSHSIDRCITVHVFYKNKIKIHMDDSEEPLQNAALVVDHSVIQHVQTLLNHIEEEGGEYRQGREAIERLQQCIEHNSPSSDVPVMEQIRRIREALERVETRVATMSEESLHIVSSSVADTQQSSDE